MFKTAGMRITLLLCAIFALNVLLATSAYRYLVSGLSEQRVRTVLIYGVAVLLVQSAVVSAVVVRVFSSPLTRLRKRLEGYRYGDKITRSPRTDEIGALQNGFYELIEELEREREKQSRIIASISHDIKTPLTSVMGYTERLKNPSLSEERRQRYLGVIYAKSKEIKNTVDEFDDYLSCSLDAGTEMELYEVGELCEGLAAQLRDELIGEQLSCKLVCRAEGTVYADRAKLYRVFMNCVSNSVRHGGRTDTEVSIYVTRDGDDFVFVLTDNGRGVGRGELEKIFEPMYTTDKSRSVAGLGLAICREIITAHGGEIYAESEKGKYFSVVFKLRAAEIRQTGTTNGK